jgi:alpha-mannosidase
MKHNVRWTAKKISQRIELIEPLVYRRRHPLSPFRYVTLPDELSEPPVGLVVDDGDWPVIEPNTYWGTWMTDFALRTTFQVPGDERRVTLAILKPLLTWTEHPMQAVTAIIRRSCCPMGGEMGRSIF